MSIYCTRLILDDTWGEHQSPLVYRRSHVLPHPSDKRGGSLETAHIPGFITRDGRDDQPEDERVWPFMRVSLTGEGGEPDTVVLDADQVRALRDDLDEWLRRVAS